VAGQVERLHGEAANVNAVPFANEEGPLRCMPGLKCLLVDRGAQLRRCGGEAAPAGSLLATAHGSNNAYAAIGSIDTYLYRCAKELIVEPIFHGEWLKGEGTPRRFGEEWRKVNGVEGRQHRRRFALHELRLGRSASRGSGENRDDSGWHEPIEWPTEARYLANEPARGRGMFGCRHQEGSLDLWREQTIGVRHAQLGLKVRAGTQATNDQRGPRFGSNANGEIGCSEDLHSCACSAELSINHAPQKSGPLLEGEERLFVGVRQDCYNETISDR
jgi:hypothetical protein